MQCLKIHFQYNLQSLLDDDNNDHSNNFEWCDTDKGQYIESQGKSLKFIGTEDTQKSMIRTTKPIPKGKFYFESTIRSLGSSFIAIGLTTHVPKSSSIQLPGKIRKTIGIEIGSKYSLLYYDGKCYDYINLMQEIGITAIKGVVGCRVESFTSDEIRYRMCNFTLNGIPIGGPYYLEDIELFPAITMSSCGAVLDINFGKLEFAHDQTGIEHILYI